MNVTNETQREFYDWCVERRAIRVKRWHGEQRPWTTDPVLDRYFFCNEVRAQDAGTRYLLDEILAPLDDWRDERTNARAIVFLCAVYRGFNLIGTFEAIKRACGGLTDVYFSWDKTAVMNALVARRALDQKVFTGAFMTAGLVNAAKALTPNCSGDEAVVWYYAKMKESLDQIANMTVYLANNELMVLESVYTALKRLPGYGRFLAYQTALDVTYAFDPDGKSLDAFTVMGPGADAGVLAIWPYVKKSDTLQYAKKLRDEQPTDLGLSLCDVEHSLCEFAKYHRIKHGTGAGTRVYRPGGSR